MLWLLNFRSKLPGYQSVLELTAEQVAAAVAEAGWVAYVLGAWQGAVRIFAKTATVGIDLICHGDGAPALANFAAPALPDGVAPVPNGALDRIFALVARIKNRAGCTEAIAQDLGIATRPPGATHATPRFRLSVEDGPAG